MVISGESMAKWRIKLSIKQMKIKSGSENGEHQQSMKAKWQRMASKIM
jgi:hypothetical protein